MPKTGATWTGTPHTINAKSKQDKITSRWLKECLRISLKSKEIWNIKHSPLKMTNYTLKTVIRYSNFNH